jgi:VanZ family protein
MWLVAIFWAAFILLLGSSYFSLARTRLVIEPVLHWLAPHAKIYAIAEGHWVVRWGAHFSEYAILALLLIWGPLRGRPLWVLLICLGCALTDEGLQWFDPARTAAMFDVSLDFGGAVSVIVIGLPHWTRPVRKSLARGWNKP